MHLYKLFLLIFILLSGSISTSSYANLVYQDSTTANASCPVDKNSPVKKKKKRFRKKLRKKALFKAPEKVNKTQDVGTIIGITSAILILLLPIFFIIMGGLTGGLGWLISGAILMGLSLILGYLLIFTKLTPLPTFGLIICSFFLLACLAFFLWALIAALPLIFTLSIIFGSIAILGLLLMLFTSIF